MGYYYNNLDVAPGLEAFEKMKAFYTENGIDILKGAVSIPATRAAVFARTRRGPVEPVRRHLRHAKKSSGRWA